MSDHFNGLSPEQAEVLALLAEECGEVVVAIGKILRHGLSSRNPLEVGGIDNSETLSRELGDVWAALDLAVAYGCVDRAFVANQRQVKMANVAQWLHHATVRAVR